MEVTNYKLLSFMNWLNVFGLTLLSLLLIFMSLRVERRALWLVLVLLVAPGIIAVGRWATVGGHWDDVAAGLGIAGLITAAWWLAGGRRLARPTSDNIKVWGQESAPRIKQSEAVALQTEVARLREEQERLEAEVRRLRGENGKEERPTKDEGRTTNDI
jgi:hypothetical protein